MKITIDIPDELVHAWLSCERRDIPPLARKNTTDTLECWILDDSIVGSVLRRNGFVCQSCGGGFYSPWYFTDCIIPVNGECRLPDGSIIASQGTELLYRGRL